jgi:hypothetical protein
MSGSIQFLKRIFNTRTLMWALFVIVALATAWGIFCVEERWRGERRWKTYRDAAVQRGAKLNMKEVIPPDVPDAENFAAIPMIQEVFAAQEQGRPIPAWFTAAKWDEVRGSSSVKNRKQPLLGSYRDALVEQGVIPAPANDPAEAVLSALKLIEPELAQLREASQRPKTKFPVLWERGIAAQIPHLGPMQRTTQVYRLGVAANLAKGNNAAAMQYLRDGFRVYYALRTECALVSGLVRISCLRVIEEAVIEDGALQKWSVEELREIESLLATVNLANDYEFAIESERALVNTVYGEMIGKSDGELSKFGNMAGISNARTSLSLYPRGWFRLSQVKTNEYFDQRIRSGLQIKSNPPEDALLRPGVGFFQRLPYVLFVLTVPALNDVQKKYAHASAFHDQVRIACALERFRRKNTSYPENLDALSPEIVATVPADPVNGLPMRYRRTGDDAFILWSVGPNLIDDGGKSDPKKSSTSQPDWVLQVPEKP